MFAAAAIRAAVLALLAVARKPFRADQLAAMVRQMAGARETCPEAA